MKGTFANIEILGEEYKFLKPKAIHVIRLEDSCLTEKGEFDQIAYFNGALGFVSKKLSVASFEKEIDPVMIIGEKTFTLADMTLEKKLRLEDKKFKDGKLDRVGYAEAIIGNCIEEWDIETLSYSEITGLVKTFDGLYETDELNGVVEKIRKFL